MTMTESQREAWEERAALIEYDYQPGISREEAERQARECMGEADE